MLMKDKFLSKAVPRGTRTIWRYLSALIILFSLSIGQMWAADPDLAIGTDGQTSSSFLGEYSTEGITLSSSASYSSGAVQLGNTPSGSSAYNAHYFEVLSSSAEIEKVSFLISGNGSNKSIQAPVFAWASTATSNTADTYVLLDAVTVTANSYAAAKWFEYDLSGANVKCARIYRSTKNISSTDPAYTGSSTQLGSGQTIKIYGIKVWLKASSGPVPVSSVAVTAPVDGNTYYVGDQVTLAATVLPANATNKTLNWTMDPSDKATIADGKITFTEAGDFFLTASATDGSGKFNKVHLYVSNPTLITSIALDYNEQHINVGDVITITPTILPATATNKNLLWSVTEGATITQEGVLTAVVQSDVIVTAEAQDGSGKSATTHIYIDPLPACATLTPATSGSAIAAGDAIDLQESAPNASMKALTANLSYTENGLLLGDNSSTKAEVTLNNLMQVGTIITATIYNDNNDKNRGLNLLNSNGTSKATWTKNMIGDHVETYTVVAGDGLAGSNVFQLQRNNNAYLKNISVANCGAELLDLSSAVTPDHDPAYATVTLSATKVVAGGSATATYSIADLTAWDFDGWEITSGDATIADPTAATAAITMGTTASVITLKLKAASTKHTVTYYDENDNNLGEELVVEGQHPVGLSIAPRKLGYTFAGWGLSKDGPVVAFNEVTVNADMPLYTIWNEIDCSAQSGTIYSMSIAVAPAENCTIKTATGYESTWDLYQYEGVSGGEAIIGNTGGSNSCILQTNKTILLKDNDSYLKLDFDCPLKEGDKIRTNVTGSGKAAYISTDATRPEESAALAIILNSTTGEIVVPAALDNAQTIYIWKGGGNVTITSINIYRPAHFAVTFNMHDHGDAVDPQSVVEGGKVTKPTDPTASGWDFGGWFKESTYDNEWDFESDVVNAATEIHAKWTEHTTSHDATLKDLTVNGVTVTGFDPATEVYNVVLEMGTTTTPEVGGVANDDNVISVVVWQTTDPADGATVTVTAEDNSTTKTYTINFSVATSKDINLVFATGTTPCKGTPDMTKQILSNNTAVSSYINQITFTNVEGSGADGAEGSSLNVGKKAGNMFTLTAKPGYAFAQMHFFAKIQDATCEYSIDGSDWTELASANTGGNECYAPFTSGTVHEFRLRSTGAEGVWIRNMQLNIIEACTPVAITWDEEPVEFEVGAAGQVIAATANTGNDVAYSSNTPSVIAVDAVNGLLSISDLGSATLSASTQEGDGTTYCANGGADIVLSKVVNTYYLVKFDAQNGEPADEVKFYASSTEIALPAAPSYPGYDFQGWFDAETGGNQYVEDITPTASMTVYAQWVAQCDGATITTQPVGTSYLTGRTATALVCEATAGAGGALTYEWFTCDDDQKTNPVAASATPSTAVAGTFYYFCKVMEAGCDKETFSDVVTITVTDKTPICLIATTVTGATAHGAVTGLYGEDKGGSADVNVTSGSYKMDKGKYIGVTLPEGYKFQEGDKVVLNVMTVNNATGFTLFDGKDGEKNLIIDTRDGNLVPAGANTVVLPAYAGSQSVYVLREDNSTTGNLNSAIDAIAVYRTCAPILNKVTVNGAEGKPNALKEVVFEVAASTTQSQLEAIAFDWVSNDDAWTAANAPVAANAWEFGVANAVTFTDKDGDQSVYTITVNKAAASTNVELATLTVNGNAVTVVPGQAEYNYELPYGTSAAPVVAAMAEDANAEVGTITQASSATGSATFKVTAEDGTTTRDYTINFSISKWNEVVIWDGSTMDAVKTVQPADIASWEAVGFTGVENWAYSTDEPAGKVPAYCSDNDKTYTHVNGSGKNECNIFRTGGNTKNSRYFKITVPKDYVAKFYVVYGSHGEGTEVTMSIGNEASATASDGILSLTTDHRYLLSGGISEIVGAGDYYLNATASADFFEIRAYLRPGYGRTAMLGNGVLGTVCVDHNVAVEDIQGVSVYELVGREPQYGKVAFDEIVSGELEAGAPYVFQAHGDRMVLFYGETKADNPVDKGNGMYGTFTDQTLYDLNDVYYFAQRALWSCVDLTSLSVPANRAYVKLSEIDYISDPNPAPGRRRILLSVNGENQTQGVDNLESGDQPMKVMIDGTLYIIRGEKVFDATGRLVK